MSGFTIQLPIHDANDSVEIEVRVNGKRRSYQYRVEVINLEQCDMMHEIRIQCIREKIEEVGEDWQLINIGAASKESIPVMFRRKQILDAAEGKT
ncbi:hypothetical protein KQI52_03290 [bacterium]|nr:hypothetical protein [bacterium]